MNWRAHLTFSQTSGDLGPTIPPEQSPGLADGFTESHMRWRDACDEVRRAYERWDEGESPKRGLEFASYRAALDREEQAARIHCEWAEHIRAAKGRL